ncbi:hypothetical protein VDP57_22165, partial [Xanthomonas campestris pv. campestris]|nr:hypothetical protein [Xanthomonas campestris pv. campestris]
TFFQAIMSQVIDLTGGNVGKPQGQVHLSSHVMPYLGGPISVRLLYVTFRSSQSESRSEIDPKFPKTLCNK